MRRSGEGRLRKETGTSWWSIVTTGNSTSSSPPIRPEPDIPPAQAQSSTPGMILADNGGNWFLLGAPDSRWNDDELNILKGLTGNDFEAVKMGPLTTQ